MLKDRPVKAITTAELYQLLERVEKAGQRDSAHTLREVIGSVIRFAIQTGRAEYDPTYALKGALLPIEVKHRAALTEERVGRLLAAIDERQGWPSLTAILQFLALTFVRPGEARYAPTDRTDARAVHDVDEAPDIRRKKLEVILLAATTNGIDSLLIGRDDAPNPNRAVLRHLDVGDPRYVGCKRVLQESAPARSTCLSGRATIYTPGIG